MGTVNVPFWNLRRQIFQTIINYRPEIFGSVEKQSRWILQDTFQESNIVNISFFDGQRAKRFKIGFNAFVFRSFGTLPKFWSISSSFFMFMVQTSYKIGSADVVATDVVVTDVGRSKRRTHPFPGFCARWWKRIWRCPWSRRPRAAAEPLPRRLCTAGPAQSRAWRCVASSAAGGRRRSWTASRRGARTRRRESPQCLSGSGRGRRWLSRRNASAAMVLVIDI